MDIPRDPKPKRKKRIIQGTVVVLALVLVTGAVRNLKPAAPSVDRAVIWTDTVQRGTMVRQVRGAGTLVPEQRRWITAVTSGRVEEIVLLPGTEVAPGDLIVRMSNPDVEMQLLQVQQQLSGAQSQLVTLRSNLETQQLSQESAIAQIRTQLQDARRQFEINQRLYDTNPDLVAAADLEASRERMEELDTRLDLERRRLDVLRSSAEEQIEAQREQVSRLRDMVRFNQDRVRSMDVTASVGGVLAELDLQEGQWVQSGQTLARVVQPGRLKAEIRINQTQAQDIVIGQRALIDTRSDTIEGQVVRIDPSVQNGSVTIDVALPEELPRSARPDLSVDGNVILQHLDDVVFFSRPNFGQANSRVGLFRLTPDGEYAERVVVQLGRASVSEIEVVDGLQPGDVVILSEMAQYDGFDRVRIK